METDPGLYLKTILDLYLALPETPARVSRSDRSLASHLFQQHVPASTVEAAFLLASARRLSRPNNAPALGPIRSLHYFLPVIEEITHNPLPKGYLDYLRHKLNTHRLTNSSHSKLPNTNPRQKDSLTN
jgi:hypothetical protein